jgi:hypothetical protein
MNDLTPSLLNENPELAALYILKTSLEVSRCALATAYPDDAEPPLLPCYGEQDAYVKAILYQMTALDAMIDGYAESIERLRAWKNQQSRGEEIPF